MAVRKKAAVRRRAKTPAKKSPVNAAAKKKAARKRVAKKAVKKASAKPTRKPVAKPAAKLARKVAGRKAPARKPAKAAAAKRPAAPKREVRPAFAAQRSQASVKDLILFEMQRARVTVHAALQGVTGGSADRAVRGGGWTIREVVLHLVARDKVRLEELGRTLGGQPASWAGLDHDEMASVNEWHLGELRHLDWDAALRLLQTKRDELVAALVAVPAVPAEVWSPEHPFGRMLHALPEHDRHHAAQIKRVRIEGH